MCNEVRLEELRRWRVQMWLWIVVRAEGPMVPAQRKEAEEVSLRCVWQVVGR